MASRRALFLSGIAGLLVGACTLIAPPDARLCAAAQNLSAAMTLTATAMDADAAGNFARAQGLATQARSMTELASSTLQGMPGESQGEPVWQALQEVSLGTAQAANSLLPAYSGTHGTGREQLDAAAGSMAKVRAGLPAMCFAIPADLETPGAS